MEVEDPFFFCRRICGYDKLIPRIHGEILSALRKHDKVGLYLPREHFKTSCVTEGYVTWRICCNHNIRVLLAHKPYREGRGYVEVIRDHLESNEVLRKCYGDMVRKGGRWGDDHFTVKGREVKRHEQTVQLASPEHYPTGGHYDLILVDDVVGLKDRYSAAERDRTARFIRALWPMLMPGGQFIDVGTRWHSHDAHGTEVLGVPSEKIPRRDDFWLRLRGAELPDGSIYFPEQFDRDRLESLKKGMGAALYSSQMLNVPQAEGLKRFDVDRFHFCPVARMPVAARKAAYIDPATGEAVDKGDYTVMVVGALANGKVYVPAAVLENGPFERVVPSIIRVLQEQAVKTVYVEANAFQTFFVRALEVEFKKAGLAVSVRKVKQSRNKEERIDAMEPVVYAGQVVFRDDWHDVYPLLISQMGDFPGGAHDDGPDALEGLLTALLGYRGARTVFLPPPPKGR